MIVYFSRSICFRANFSSMIEQSSGEGSASHFGPDK